jgi:hypothetical protein
MVQLTLSFPCGKTLQRTLFQLPDYPLPTVELLAELQQFLTMVLDKILQMCEDFPALCQHCHLQRRSMYMYDLTFLASTVYHITRCWVLKSRMSSLHLIRHRFIIYSVQVV